jgi:hypothetical protein
MEELTKFIKDLLKGVEFENKELGEKITDEKIDDIIDDIKKDAYDTVGKLIGQSALGVKSKKIVEANDVQKSISEIVAKNLKLKSNDDNLKNILNAKLNPDKVDINFNQKVGGEVKRADSFMTVLMEMSQKFMMDDLENIESKRKKGKEIVERETKSQKKGIKLPGGRNVKASKVEKPSFRGLDVSRISKMVQEMFRDIQTMGFAALYLKENSQSWKDAEQRTEQREEEQAKMEMVKNSQADSNEDSEEIEKDG